jgi:Protein of unknown function (DUF2934)
MNDMRLYDEIFTLASHLNERSGRIEGRALNNWLEAERIVRTLRKIAGRDGKRYILVNVPETRYAEKRKNRNEANPRKKIAYRAITNSPKTISDR